MQLQIGSSLFLPKTNTRAVDHYTFLDTIKILPNAIWNKYMILTIPSLPHPTPEHTEGLNCSILTKVLCLLKLWKPNSFLRGSLIFFFPLGPQNHKPEFSSCWSAASACLEDLWVSLHKPLWKGGRAHMACASSTRCWTSADSSDHLTLCLCCCWMDMWAEMVVRMATKYLCFRTLDGESCSFRVVGFFFFFFHT